MEIRIVQNKDEFETEWEAENGQLSLYRPEAIGFASTYLFAAIQITYLDEDGQIAKFRFSIEPQECRSLAEEFLAVARDVAKTSPPGTA